MFISYMYRTSESVASGHPDKIADQISDSIVDQAIRLYPKSRVAVETLVTKNRIICAGEVTCPKQIPYHPIIKSVISDLGYIDDQLNFTSQSPITVLIHEQSPDISKGVDNGGAGDQGMMIGYACNETPEYMPLPIMISHALVKAMDDARNTKTIPFLRPDGKSEVTIKYDHGLPKQIDHIILAVPHLPHISNNELKHKLVRHVIKPVVQAYHMNIPDMTSIIINGTGRWEIGGPASDTGVTGRKIIVDTYGSIVPHGGGAFSGKDPTKVDRSGAYAARFIAKNIVAAHLADRVEVHIAYCIGKRDPISRNIDTLGTEYKTVKLISDFAWKLLDLSVRGIIDGLQLEQPIYQKTARYGHFGNPSYPWEKIR